MFLGGELDIDVQPEELLGKPLKARHERLLGNRVAVAQLPAQRPQRGLGGIALAACFGLAL
jgi:hypothetical protein